MSTRSSSTFLVAALLSGAVACPAQTIDKVAGLRAPIEIIRDGEGVPHVRAQSEADALFGLGFVHAQDRLWQMEFLRRVGSGRLSEVLGPKSLDSDKLFRSLGVAQSAAATWERYGPRERELVLAYVAGLNAATDRQRGHRPPEYLYLGFAPESWKPVDVLVMAKVLGWSVDRNWTQELVRAQLAQKLGPERAAQLTPPYAKNDPITLPQAPAGEFANFAKAGRRVSAPKLPDTVITGLLALERNVQSRTGLGGQGLGSNNQVLAGSRSATGRPILAADPHLPSQIPSIFYRAHLTGGELNAIGVTAPGLPGFMMGHNEHIAWGWTNANADVQDLFIEKLHNGTHAEYDGRLEPLQIRVETIRVKGTADVHLTVRSTRNGALVSDLIDPNGPALALRWAALDDDDDIGVAAYLEANRAQNWRQFTSAFRRSKAHAQNIVYADRDGNIGYLMAGTIPVRASGDGSAPVPGWTSAYAWTGYVAFDDLPMSLNPRQGYLASSNNRIAGPSYPHTIGSSFAAPYRANRVLDLLRANRTHSVSDMESIQADVYALHARETLPVLANVAPSGPREREALAMLRNWDLRVTADSAPAAIFEAWYIQLAESIFADELGDALWRAYSDHLHMVSIALASAIHDQPAWCDDVTTPTRESCQAIAASALSKALDRMTEKQGTAAMSSWRWSKAHRIVFFHQPFDSDPALAQLFNRVAPNGGDKHTVNVASNPRWREYDQRHLALYRQVIDLADLDNSRWMAAPGQSGIVFDPLYDDRIPEWLRVEYRPMRFTRPAVDREAVERVVLRP